jgi:multicomponent Na+:H+ antiporter subunit D
MSSAGLASLLPLAPALPLAGAAVVPLLARISGRLAVVVSLLTLVGSTVILALVAPRVFGGTVVVHYVGGWTPVRGAALGIALAVDAWGLTFALAATGIGSVLLLYTLSELGTLGPRELGGMACLFLLLDAALVGVALTADLVNLFVWFEVAAIASYALTGFFLERPLALEAAFKILVLTNIAAFAVFIGASLVYADRGALNLGQAHLALGHPDAVALIALALLVAGMATKAGLVPFHAWLPDAHTAAPGPVSALFSGLMVNLGIVAIGRLCLQVFDPHTARPVLGLLMVLGLVSAVGGAVFALLQDDLKRLLAYDTISQMGVLAVGLATGTATGVAGAAYHLVGHALFKSLLFLCAGAIVHGTGVTALSEMGGLARRTPWLAAAFLLGVAAIAGVPPLNGYVSVGLIHQALEDEGQWVPFALMLVAQAVTVAALGKAGWQAFLRPREHDYDHDEPLRAGMATAMVTLGGACVVLGVAPTFVLHHVAGPAAGGLLDARHYATAVLAGGGRVAAPRIRFHYLSPTELAAVAATLVAALPLARLALRRGGAPLVDRVRSIQTGSVNDYAAYQVIGLVVTAAVLVLG